MTKTTITRGLVELKTLDARINAAISGGTFVAAVRGTAEVPLGRPETKDQVVKTIVGSYDTVASLIKRRDAIKRAIIVSNAKTLVKVAGEEMTVAEAIERKASIAYDERLVNTLRVQYTQVSHAIAAQNARVEQDIDKRASALFGSDKTKISKEQYDMVVATVKTDNEAKLLDPKNVVEQFTALQKKVEDFKADIDIALTESNSRTEIEIAD